MIRRLFVAVVLVALAAALWTWRDQLFTVARSGDVPRALGDAPAVSRPPLELDVALPLVPAGIQRLRPGPGALLIHYWAPWERHGRAQAAALDSLRGLLAAEDVRVVMVCFDPLPSVARFVHRQRLRVPVLLDVQRHLREALPCPSIPYTYVLDGQGRVVIAQAGEVDWLSPTTAARLRRIVTAGRPGAPPA